MFKKKKKTRKKEGSREEEEVEEEFIRERLRVGEVVELETLGIAENMVRFSNEQGGKTAGGN